MAVRFFTKTSSSAAAATWPAARVVAALKKHFQRLEHLGDEDGFSLYGVQDRGIRFVVALILPAGAADKVAEVAFLARFVDYAVEPAMIETMNKNLHFAVAGMEGPDLFLLAGVEATGSFNEGAFTIVLDTWRRDLMMVMHVLSSQPSLTAAFPAARLEVARAFAVNKAPEGDGVRDLLKSYLGAGTAKALCGDCGGRGKRGLVARTCEACSSSGFVADREKR